VTARSQLAERLALGAILLGYLLLGVAYARATPPWQAPDEPAHFNYVRQLAADPLRLPVIEPGDWPNDRLEELKATGFPPAASIEGISYEDHQAPAWYYLMLPAYELGGGNDETRLARLRLWNLLLGALGVWLVWRLVRSAWPDDGDRLLALGAAGFVAFLPMRLAVTASASNDPLAECVSTAALLLATRRIRGRMTMRRWTWGGGLLLALAFLTKVSAYSAAIILVAGEGLAWWRRGRFGTALAALTALQVLLIGLVLGALPWFLRNSAVYGAGDWMGRAAHDRVVAGQPTTSAWIAAHGLWGTPDALLQRMVTWTFESFWGVFGWMGVFLDSRLYALLALASLVALAGFIGYAVGLYRHRRAERADERAVVALLALAIAASVAGFLWWNLSFVQHQGRYLFPALGAIAAFTMLGLRQVGRWAGRPLGERWRPWLEAAVPAGFVVALTALAVVALVKFVVPGLQ
jgi:4-amino-4-deoxy-L-arabinose transferase-like glycosyltransferase